MKRFGKGGKGAAPPPLPPSMPPMPPGLDPATPPPPPPAGATAAPAPDPAVTTSRDMPPEEKPVKSGESKSRRLNRLLQSAKPAAGRLFQGLPGLRRDSANSSGDIPSISPNAGAEAGADEKAERRAAQQAQYEAALAEWERERKSKQNEAEIHGLPFDESELPARPMPPVVESDSDSEAAPHSEDEDDRPPAVASTPPPPSRSSSGSAFRPIAQPPGPPVVAEVQRAGVVAEMFAAKAYGAPVNPAAVPGSLAPKSPLFGGMPGPMLPAAARPSGTGAAPPPEPRIAPQAHAPSVFQTQPPPPVAPGAAPWPPSAAAPGMQPHYGAGLQYIPPQPLPQSNTYIDPALADKIRRGRELEKLGIDEEERGNMGHAQAAYMKALELIIPSIPGLDHGNDVSYSFRMGEKRKLEKEAGLMLDRCEEIKRFLVLNSAAVPLTQPKKISQLRRERRDDDDDDDSNGGNVPAKHVSGRKVKTPLQPPPSNLLEGFSALGLSDPLAQQERPGYPPMPAPMPPAIPTERLRAQEAGQARMSGAERQEMLSRPPALNVPPGVPMLPPTPPALMAEQAKPGQFEDADAHPHAKEGAPLCQVCKKAPASLAGKCNHVFCAPCGNRSTALGWCLEPDCSARLQSEDIRHIVH